MPSWGTTLIRGMVWSLRWEWGSIHTVTLCPRPCSVIATTKHIETYMITIICNFHSRISQILTTDFHNCVLNVFIWDFSKTDNSNQVYDFPLSKISPKYWHFPPSNFHNQEFSGHCFLTTKTKFQMTDICQSNICINKLLLHPILFLFTTKKYMCSKVSLYTWTTHTFDGHWVWRPRPFV